MTRVALVGANGHGLHHRRHIATLDGVELVGLCDTAPVQDPPEGVPVFADAARMLRETRPDIAIVATPPHTHLPLAVTALRAGADVLLEKPPVLDLAEHESLRSVAAETGRAVQVGFQALASPDLPSLRGLAPCDVSVLGSWQRDDHYWARSAWAGRHPFDGALRNPFAHAVMQALAVARSEPVRVEVAWCRTRDIEVDDTSTLRLTLGNGRRVLIAVTLAGEEFIDGRMCVAGTRRLDFRDFHGPSLLRNLIAFRAGEESLLAPLEATRAFTAVSQALKDLPRPGFAASVKVGGETRTLPGINEALRQCADGFALLNEIDSPLAATVTGGTATIG